MISSINREKKMPRSGFEPESSAREAEMIGRTTPARPISLEKRISF